MLSHNKSYQYNQHLLNPDINPTVCLTIIFNVRLYLNFSYMFSVSPKILVDTQQMKNVLKMVESRHADIIRLEKNLYVSLKYHSPDNLT